MRTTWLTLLTVAMLGEVAVGNEPVDFSKNVRPLLARTCFACHGRDEEARKAELRLDVRKEAVAAGAIEPGDADSSELVSRIESTEPELMMPPPGSGHSLSGTERRLLRTWIEQGAKYEEHWAFTPPRKAPLPDVEHADWPRHAIDRFVLARLETEGLTSADEADRYRWLRRVSLDLTGLPPTPEEADAFARDERDDAYERVVDRLLESSAYGEHWARMWLDLARYADTKGYEKDRPRTIWPYRDWVIDALNRDLPYDQFTLEQLAGDLLPKVPAQRTENPELATAFHRNTMTNDEGGTDNEEFRVAAVKDRVDTTMQVWMGLTMGCAKCHSHKYDPIEIDEYYGFYALFNQTEDADRTDDAPLISVPTADQSRRIAKLEADLKRQRDAKAEQSEIETTQKKLAAARKAAAQVPVMRELAADKQRTTRLHTRGNFLDPGDPVDPGVPEAFGEWPEDAPRNRLGVARWLFHPRNPLTARVAVNRIWARLMGTGIVETEEDFGTQGTPPSHPELLDWLAVDFRENGWSTKQLIRTIVLSSTYRQAGLVTEEKLAKDPNNRLLSRGPRFRLPAETIRDQALAVSGLLTRKVGGPSVMPPQPAGVWKSTYNASKWVDATGPDRYRRGLYTFRKRTSPYPPMLAFDAGSGEVCQVRRIRTNTPLQALVTLNDPAFVEAAGALATRMSETPGDTSARVTRGFRLVLVRPPSDRERDRLVSLYGSLATDFANDPAAAKELLVSAGLETGDPALVAVANVLLNLDETLTKP